MKMNFIPYLPVKEEDYPEIFDIHRRLQKILTIHQFMRLISQAWKDDSLLLRPLLVHNDNYMINLYIDCVGWNGEFYSNRTIYFEINVHSRNEKFINFEKNISPSHELHSWADTFHAGFTLCRFPLTCHENAGSIIALLRVKYKELYERYLRERKKGFI